VQDGFETEEMGNRGKEKRRKDRDRQFERERERERDVRDLDSVRVWVCLE